MTTSFKVEDDAKAMDGFSGSSEEGKDEELAVEAEAAEVTKPKPDESDVGVVQQVEDSSQEAILPLPALARGTAGVGVSRPALIVGSSSGRKTTAANAATTAKMHHTVQHEPKKYA